MLSSESCHFYSWIRFERMHLSVYVLSLEWIFTHPCLFIFAFFFIYMKCQASSASTMICWNQVIQGRHICTDGRISSWYSQAPSMCCRNEEVPKSELTHHTRWKQNFFFLKKNNNNNRCSLRRVVESWFCTPCKDDKPGHWNWHLPWNQFCQYASL